MYLLENGKESVCARRSEKRIATGASSWPSRSGVPYSGELEPDGRLAETPENGEPKLGDPARAAVFGPK